MKLNEIIELNKKEYTVELNRESILRIEQYASQEKFDEEYNKVILEDKTDKEIADDENPFAESIDEDALEESANKKIELIKTKISRAFWIWLYPVHKLSYKEVQEILQPYFDDDEKAEFIGVKYKEFSEKSIEVREKYLEERKNLKALTK